MSAFPLVTREELKAKIDRGENFYLVEALSPELYRRAHLPGAVNVPPDQAGLLAPQLLPDKNREVITYCGGPL
jgi:rhodanese-related sulfurtransferase